VSEVDDFASWLSNPNNVYCGRGGVITINGVSFPNHNSVLCNRFIVGRDGDPQDVLECYRDYMKARIQRDKTLRKYMYRLKGKNIACLSDVCHCEITLSLINEIELD
jgi:hypothetical protein